MSEFRLHQLVKNLLESLGSNEDEQSFVDSLQQSINMNQGDIQNIHLAMQSHITHLAQNSNNPEAFQTKYEDLVQKDVDGLASFVEIIHELSQNRRMNRFLSISSKNNTDASCSKTTITKHNLLEVKTRLKSATSMADRYPNSNEDNLLANIITASNKDIPTFTSWVQRRPNLSWDFPSCMNLMDCASQSIRGIPVCSQENILIEELSNVLMGLPGAYIQPKELKNKYDPVEFVVNEHVDHSLKELVKQILPLASHYSIVQRFTEEKMRFEFGQVNNALAEFMNKITIDHLHFVTRLETEARRDNLNLHKLWFYIQNNLHSLSIVSKIAMTINRSDSRGGKVLSLLHDNITEYIGDSKAQDLCLQMMQAACVPYMKTLGMWIYKGIISDPIHEFLVEDQELVQKEEMPVDYSADYWDKKYTIRRERIPKFLEPISDIILRAGKYLNVIRQCGKTLCNKVEVIEYKKEEKHYIEAIEKAYKYASETLLDVIMKEQDLLGRLKSVKHYFLLDQGDFIVTLLTLCEKEWSKYVVDIVHARLESLLDLALRLSSANKDPYKDDLKTELLQYDLQSQMFKILMIQTNEEKYYKMQPKPSGLSVIESFSFNYEVKWPLSLILNRKSLTRYQMIFRHLFYCKYVERMICQVWRSNKVAKSFQLEYAKHYRYAFALRQRMLHCVQNLEYHMMVEVIEPHWCVFQQKIAKVSNVDEILIYHDDFLDTCLKDCMLTIPSLLTIIMKLLSICVQFCKFMQTEPVHPEGIHENSGSFEANISTYDMEFTAALMQLLDQINELNGQDLADHDRLFNLLYRLDFNLFYSGQFNSMKSRGKPTG